MSENNGRNMRRHAASALANVTPSHAEALTVLAETDAPTLAAIVTMVNASGCDAEAGAYAVVCAPRMWLDRDNGATVLAVVRKAIRMGERYAAMAAWDSYGDMTDAATMTDDGDARTVVSHNGTAPADSRFGVTYGDVVMTASGMVPETDGETIRTAGRAYVKARRAYDNGDRVGRPVSFAGALAMSEGVGPDDSRYHAARRLTLGAVRRVNRGAVLAVTGAPGARPTYGANRSGAVMVTPASAPFTVTVPGRAGRAVPGARVTVRRAVTVDHVRTGAPFSGAGDVMVWNGRAVVSVDVRTARVQRFPMVDVMGYESRFGYGALATVPGAPLWRAVRETRETVRETAPVVVGARPAMLPPDVIVTRGADGTLSARVMTETETENATRPDARRVARVAPPLAEDSPNARPDDSPARGDLTVSGMLKAYKPVVSPRYRPGGNTGSTVPARLAK